MHMPYGAEQPLPGGPPGVLYLTGDFIFVDYEDVYNCMGMQGEHHWHSVPDSN